MGRAILFSNRPRNDDGLSSEARVCVFLIVGHPVPVLHAATQWVGPMTPGSR